VYTKHVIRLFPDGSLKDLQRTTCSRRILMYTIAWVGGFTRHYILEEKWTSGTYVLRHFSRTLHIIIIYQFTVHIKTRSRSPPRRRKIYTFRILSSVSSTTSDDVSLDILIIYNNNNNMMMMMMMMRQHVWRIKRRFAVWIMRMRGVFFPRRRCPLQFAGHVYVYIVYVRSVTTKTTH